LAGVGLRNREKLIARNLQIVEQNLPLYDSFFEKYAQFFSWYRPNAGPITFVKMNFDMDDMAFAKKVRKEKSVLILPGGIYDYSGYFRIGFARKGIPEALEKFEEYVDEHLL